MFGVSKLKLKCKHKYKFEKITFFFTRNLDTKMKNALQLNQIKFFTRGKTLFLSMYYFSIFRLL